MIYFLWSVLNLAALIWFLFICFSVLKLVKESMGIASVVIFVLGCLSFLSAGVKNPRQELPFGKEIANEAVEVLNIKKDLFYNLDLMYVDQKDSLGKEIPATTVKHGFIIGHEWKPLGTTVYFKDGILHYTAMGLHEWKFLGLILYSDGEDFKGIK